MGKRIYRKIPVVLMLIVFITSALSGCMFVDFDHSNNTNHSVESTHDADELNAKPDEYGEEDSVVQADDAEADVAETEESDVTDADMSETEENDSTDADDVEKYAFNSIEAISEICGLKATVEKKIAYCYVDMENTDNPYDVTWDYGEDYNTYVDACDWSLVFDADYYMDTFPMLAMLYHYDEDLLLVHFQTVGIHEGRQGSADFNVSAYATNADSELYDTFGRNFEGYYIYYMLNYETEKNIDTVNNADGSATLVQYTQNLTALQKAELEGINEYRADLDREPLVFDSELAAAANLRAYMNASSSMGGHDWANANTDDIYSWIRILGADTFSENTVTIRHAVYKGATHVEDYADSDKHYEAMTNSRFNFTGISNTYTGSNLTSQFDVFTGELDTPTHNEG